MEIGIVPVCLLIVLAAGLALGMLIVAGAVHPRRKSRVKQAPYESGMDPVHDTRRRFDVRFYLVAITLLVFDVELVFLYPWAVAVRPAMMADADGATEVTPLGIDAAVANGWVESRHFVFFGAMLFLGLLTLGFIYDWRKGVFRWR